MKQYDKRLLERIPFCPKCMATREHEWKALWLGLSKRVKCSHCGYKWNPDEEKFFREKWEYMGEPPPIY